MCPLVLSCPITLNRGHSSPSNQSSGLEVPQLRSILLHTQSPDSSKAREEPEDGALVPCSATPNCLTMPIPRDLPGGGEVPPIAKYTSARLVSPSGR